MESIWEIVDALDCASGMALRVLEKESDLYQDLLLVKQGNVDAVLGWQDGVLR